MIFSVLYAILDGNVASKLSRECDLGGKRGCPEIGKAEEGEGEARGWNVPDSATCFLSSFTSLSGGWAESSSMSSPEKEKLNADMFDVGVEFVELIHVRSKFPGWVEAKGEI